MMPATVDRVPMALAGFLLLACTSGATAEPWRIQPGVSFAYDSFGQRYVVTEDDTLDLVDELSTRVHLRVERLGRTRVEFRNMLGIGQEAVRDHFDFGIARAFDRGAEVRVRQELRFTDYRERNDDNYASDSWVGTTRAMGAWRLDPQWRVRIDDRYEWATFDPTDRYNYRYRLNDVSAELERRTGVFSASRAAYGYGWRTVPDSTAIDYRRHLVGLGWAQEWRTHAIGLDQRVERRLYRDIETRSHFWDVALTLDSRVEFQPRLRVRPIARAEWVTYDRPDSLWADSREQSVEVLLEAETGNAFVWAIGPRAEFRRTTSSVDRAYNQWGVSGRVTVSLGTELWLQWSDEIGIREHLAGDDLLYTDYWFNWMTLYLTWQPLPRLGVDVFCSYDPENHDDDLDDTTTLLLSTAVVWGWR